MDVTTKIEMKSIANIRPAAGKGESPDRLVWRPRRGSQPPPREAPGHRPPLLRRAAHQGLDVAGRAGEIPRAKGSEKSARVAEDTVLETEIATTERRKAWSVMRRAAPRSPPQGGDLKAPFGALSPSPSSQGKDERPRAQRGNVEDRKIRGVAAKDEARGISVRVLHQMASSREARTGACGRAAWMTRLMRYWLLE